MLPVESVSMGYGKFPRRTDSAPARKALEAYLTLLIEALWSKQRIMEVYRGDCA